MTDNFVLLNEFEQDAIAEIANLGIGRAANALRKLVGEQVFLSVPSVQVVTRKAASQLVETSLMTKLVAVQQKFAGSFSGAALLIFPEPQSLELIRAIVGAEKSLQEILELEDDALAETGNIILNSYLGTIGSVLNEQFEISLPSVIRARGKTLFNSNDSQSENPVLLLYINFKLRTRAISGFVALLMDVPGLESFRMIVRQFVENQQKQS